jgi:hypothetical protein
MVAVYGELIMKGKKTIDDVPAKLRADVIKYLEDHGWVD